MTTPINSPFLTTRSQLIRSKSIPWEGYQRAGLLTAEDVALISKVTSSNSAEVVDKDPKVYISLYTRLLTKLSRTDTLQFILVLVGDSLEDHDERVSLFVDSDEDIYAPIMKLVDSSDPFVQLKSLVLLSTFITSSTKNSVVTSLLKALLIGLQSSTDQDRQDVSVQSLESILRIETVRKLFWSFENGVGVQSLVDLLKSNTGSQMQYQVIFCFWLLTFDDKIADEIDGKYHLIPLLVTISRTAIKEKVLRISLSTFRNLITKAPSSNLPSALVAKLLPFVDSIKDRKWSDDDVKDDVEFLREELKKKFDGLTTYDEYTSELESGLLSWTPTHKNDDFWRDNAHKLVEKDKTNLKLLVNLLLNSTDPLVLAVAANDVAQFAKYYDSGKKSLEELGAKTRVMELMSHADADVKYQSLVAVQRLLSLAWA